MNTSEIIKKTDEFVMGTYNRFPIALKKGKGSRVWDFEDRSYLDFTTGISVTSLGHSNEIINSVIEEQIKDLTHVSNLFYTEQQAELASLLVSSSFADRVFFCNSGTEATEACIKLARKWGYENGKRYRIISTYGAFHGRTFGALSATGNRKHQMGYAPLVEGFDFVPYGTAEPVREIIRQKDICAIIVEPIQGENGVILPPHNYLKNLREICDEYNILLILDEIQVGMGRTGKLFAYEHEDIKPDIMALAKSLGGGIPCGAALASEDVASHFTPGSHGSTFGGNPLAMRCAKKVVETVSESGFLKSVSDAGDYFLDRLGNLSKVYPDIVKEVRGKGLILGMEYRTEELAKKISNALVKNGLLTILTAGKVTRILPPLIVTKDEIDEAMDIIRKSVEEVG